MIYALPPVPPAIPDYLASDCEKGSRECFPEDRVGVATQPLTISAEMISAELSLLFAELGSLSSRSDLA